MQIIKSLTAYCFLLILFTQAPAFAQLPGQLSIEQAVNELNDLMDVQNAFGIQDPNLSYGMRKALVLADLLLNPDGTLNPALCQTLKPYFVPENPLRYEENIGRILDQLDSSWEPFFDQITLPNADSSYANQVLRGLFGISPNQPLTDRHAKWAVLASLFAPYNQGPVGDCFAVSVLIRDHEKYYLHTANDSAEIVQKGFITRLVRNREDNFFFLPILADSDYENNISIDASGQISGTSLNLLDAPGFIAAGNAMGLSNISDYAQGILQILLSNPASTNGAVSVAQVIDAIAQTFFSQQTKPNTPNTSSLGRYGFSCLTNNPVLRAVEDIFAAMAEDLPNDSTRGNINDCVEESLASIWKQVGNSEAAKNLHQAISTAFDESYRLVYNGCIPLPAVAGDGSSTSGGFQLFRRNLNNSSDIGVQVITPADFQSLVLDAISAVSSSVETSAEIQNIISQLQNYIQSGNFLKNALWAYDPSNKKVADPVANYQQLTRSPMQSCDGDNPFEVADIDTGVDCDSNVQTYIPKNTQTLITWCLNLSKTVPAGLYPMNSPEHAFNLDTSNPDLVNFVNSGISADVWIRKMITVPGMSVASKKIDAQTQQALGAGVYNYIANALPSDKAYQLLLSRLAKENLTVQKYATRLLEGIEVLLLANSEQRDQLGLLIDYVLIQVLPPNDSALIQQSAIRFAFTNWNIGVEDLYFCAYFNPRTANISFGYIDENKQELQPMDEQEWVNNQQWEVELKIIAPIEEAI